MKATKIPSSSILKATNKSFEIINYSVSPNKRAKNKLYPSKGVFAARLESVTRRLAALESTLRGLMR